MASPFVINPNGFGETLASFSTTLSIGNAFSLLQANDLVVIAVATDGGITCSGITGSGLTFAQRGAVQTSGVSMSVWSALVPAPATGFAVSAAFSGSYDDAVANFAIIRGAYAPHPFDSNGGLPATTGGTPPATVTFSTSMADDLLLFFQAGSNTLWIAPPPQKIAPSPPWTYLVSAGNSGGFGFVGMSLYTQTVAAAQSGATAGSFVSISGGTVFFVDAITADASAPAVPTGLVCGADSLTSITPTWSAAAGALTYTLQYRVLGTVPWTQITGLVATFVLISGLLAGTQYEWQVEAVNGSGNSGFSGSAVCSTASPAAPIPGRPQSLQRYRGQAGINYNGLVLVGDAFSGVVGKMNFNTYSEFGSQMLGQVASPPIHADRARIFVERFELDVESGVGLPLGQGSDPVWMLDWSKDGGRTFEPLQVFRTMGRVGAYLTRLRWLRLGQARQWVFRLQSTDPVRRVIIGTYLDVKRGME